MPFGSAQRVAEVARAYQIAIRLETFLGPLRWR